MSFIYSVSGSDGVRPLSALREGDLGVVAGLRHDFGTAGRAERLSALGVTPGARVKVLQTAPGVVFLCDQTELVVERAIAHGILIRFAEVLS